MLVLTGEISTREHHARRKFCVKFNDQRRNAFDSLLDATLSLILL